MLSISSSKRDALLLFFLSLLLFTVGLGHQEIIGFESRFYLFALEMWRHGLSFFPTTYHHPYPDYPATSTALIYLTARLTGVLNKGIAVFPSAFFAALTVSATYLIGVLQERRFGWYSAGFLLFTLAFFSEARTISLDMYVTAMTAWIFYLAYAAKLSNQSCPRLIFLLLVFSFAIRGPLGIVIPTGVLCVFYCLEKDWKQFFRVGIGSFLLLLLCTSCLLGLAYHAGGNAFLQEVLHMEVFGRMQENQTPPHYFYWVENIGAYFITYPLAILILIGIAPQLLQKNASPHIQFLRILVGWVLIILLGLSIPADKKIRYVLPIAPALALFCASLFFLAKNQYLHGLKKIFVGFCGIFPLLGLLFLALLYHRHFALNYAMLVTLLGALQIAILVARHKDVSFFLALLSFLLLHIFVIEKINVGLNETHDFVQSVEDFRQQHHAALGFYQQGKDGLVIKYLANMQQDEQPVFLNDLTEAMDKSIVIVSTRKDFDALPATVRHAFGVLMTGKLGRAEMVVLIKRGVKF